jgi:hypothetical protein
VLCLWPALAAAQGPPPPATASGSLSSTTSVTLNTSGYASVAAQLTGTWTATITFEGSLDGSTFTALNMTPTNSSSATTTATSNGVWVGSVGGLRYMRARVSAYTSGTVAITLQAALSGGGSGGGGGGGSAPSGTIGAAVPSTASPVAGQDNSGNLAYFKFDVSGNLLTAVTGAGSGGTSSTDGAAYTAGATAGTPAIGARDDAASGTVAEDKLGIVRITTNRAEHVNLRDASGNELGIAAAPVQVSLANTAANATAVKVDGSAVTQPISQSALTTFGTTQRSWDSTAASPDRGISALAVRKDSPTVLAVAADVYAPMETDASGRLYVNGSSVTQPVSGTVTTTPPANASTNVAQVAGNTTDTNSGVKSAGTLRVVLATDQPQLTNKLLVTPDANSAVNVAQFGGANVVTGTGVGGAGIPRVTVSSDSTVTANAGTNLNTSLLALESGGNLATLAGTVTAARAAVNPISGQAGVAGNTGVVGATTQRVTLATDVALPTGTNSIGAVTQGTASNLKTEIWGAAKGASAAAAPTVASIDANHAGLEVAAYQIGAWSVTESGSKSNNTAAPGATNVGTLPGVATAAAPSYTEGNQVALSTDLTGALRVSGSSGGGVAQTQVRNALNTWTDVGYYTSNASMPVQDASLMQLLNTLILVAQQAGYIKGTFGRPVSSTGDALNVNIKNPLDPCGGAGKGNVAISQTATSRLIQGMPGKQIYVCSARVVAGAAEIVNFTEGTGSTCGTNTRAVSGSTTAANGESYAANGGFSSGAGVAIMVTTIPGNDLCLLQSGSNRLAGNLTYVFQ